MNPGAVGVGWAAVGAGVAVRGIVRDLTHQKGSRANGKRGGPAPWQSSLPCRLPPFTEGRRVEDPTFPLTNLPSGAAATWDLYPVPTPQEMADSLPGGLLVALPENQSLMSPCSTPPPLAVQTQK